MKSTISKILYEAYKKIDSDFLETLKPELAKAAQKAYDEWDQDENGYCHTYGDGGICQDIAFNFIDDVFQKYDIESTNVLQTTGEVHVYCVVMLDDGVFRVDIDPFRYETGGGYTWKKIKDIVFEPEDIEITMLSDEPEDFKNFLDEEQRVLNESLNPDRARAKKIVFRASNQFSNQFKIKNELKFTASSFKTDTGYTDYIFISGHQSYKKSDFNFLKTQNSKIYFRGGPNYKVLAVFGDDQFKIVNLFKSMKSSGFLHEVLNEKFPENTYTYSDYADIADEYHKKMPLLPLPPFSNTYEIAFDEEEGRPYESEFNEIIEYLRHDNVLAIFKENRDIFYFILEASKELIEKGYENNPYFTQKRVDFLINLYFQAVKEYKKEKK